LPAGVVIGVPAAVVESATVTPPLVDCEPSVGVGRAVTVGTTAVALPAPSVGTNVKLATVSVGVSVGTVRPTLIPTPSPPLSVVVAGAVGLVSDPTPV